MKHEDEALKRALLIQTRIAGERLYIRDLLDLVDDDTANDLRSAAVDLRRAEHHVNDAVNRLRLPHNH